MRVHDSIRMQADRLCAARCRLRRMRGVTYAPAAMMVTLKKALTETLRALQDQPLETLLETREDKILSYGKFKEIPAG